MMLFLPQEKQHLSFFHYLNPTEYYLFFKSTKLNDDEPKKARFTSRSHSQSMEIRIMLEKNYTENCAT